MLVYEPCNTVSNAAYYRTAANLCGAASDMSRGDRDAVVAAVAHMAFGSSFWHGSHTRLGNVADNGLIQVIAYADYQVMVRHLVGGVYRRPAASFQGFGAGKRRNNRRAPQAATRRGTASC